MKYTWIRQDVNHELFTCPYLFDSREDAMKAFKEFPEPEHEGCNFVYLYKLLCMDTEKNVCTFVEYEA